MAPLPAPTSSSSVCATVLAGALPCVCVIDCLRVRLSRFSLTPPLCVSVCVTYSVCVSLCVCVRAGVCLYDCSCPYSNVIAGLQWVSSRVCCAGGCCA